MIKSATAIALAFALSAGAMTITATSAEAAPKAKFYSLKEGKWLPMDQHPFFKKQEKKKKAAAQKSRKKKTAIRTKRSQLPLFGEYRRNKQKPKKQVAARRADPNESPIPRKLVSFSTSQPVGTIIIDVSDRRLYHVQGYGRAMSYAVGVGKQGFGWTGTEKISRKAEWPGWTPPKAMIAREAKKGRHLPAYMEGGPNNPLGARALYLGSSLYRIHGTNQPWSLGRAVSSGCIRMANNDVSYLYNKVGIGTKVIVRQ